ncbi:MAG: hypothetical protein QMD16_14340, partial [Desulfitobacteriaceae bacterium]|nr:hypothetical protein [Desulfitobacteriaceae bacterium]
GTFNTVNLWTLKSITNSNDSKAKRRAAMAMLMSESDESINTWSDAQNWKNIKIRTNILFDCLEKAGCFILRKGAIESYYTCSNKETSTGKPSEALEEIESLRKRTNEFVDENYNDILRALYYSSKTNQIDESDAIKRELLSEVAPILHILSDKTTVSDINAVVQQSRGTDKTLFVYELINDCGTLGINVDLSTKIIDVVGFPFLINKGNNVNDVVEKAIRSRR